MEQIVNKIISLNSSIWKQDPKVDKINAGFTNTVFSVDNKHIIKICTKIDNEKAFQSEIEFYLQNKDNDKIPKLLSYDTSKKEVPYMYEVLEKLEGVSLYYIWPNLSESEREDIIRQLCDILKSFHTHHGESYDWAAYIKHHAEKYLKQMGNDLFTDEEIDLIKSAISKFDEYLKSSEFVFIHNDIHFDNIFYKDGKIKIIDFERSMIAPIDKELDIFYRMVEMPLKYASEEAEKYVKVEDYQNIKTYVEKYYPNLVDIPNLDVRLAIYDLREFLRAYSFYQDEDDLKSIIINKAKYIVSYNKEN